VLAAQARGFVARRPPHPARSPCEINCLSATAAVPSEVTPADSTSAARQLYGSGAERFGAEAQRLQLRVRLTWVVLAASGVALVGALVAIFAFEQSLAAWGTAAAISLLSGAICTVLSIKGRDAVEFAEQMAEVNVRSIARLDRDCAMLSGLDFRLL